MSVVGLVLVGVVLVGHLFAPAAFTECKVGMYSRSSNPDSSKSAYFPLWVRESLTQHLLQMYWAWMILVWGLREWRRCAALVVYFALWFPGMLVIEAAKLLFDPGCHVRGNGISGHFFYYGWGLYSLTFHRDMAPTPFVPTFAVFSLLYAWQGAITILYGYHTLAQCTLGFGLGLLYGSLSGYVERFALSQLEKVK